MADITGTIAKDDGKGHFSGGNEQVTLPVDGSTLAFKQAVTGSVIVKTGIYAVVLPDDARTQQVLAEAGLHCQAA
jgi:hypothetical protein